jgi:phenylalanine-4-hydroxylase
MLSFYSKRVVAIGHRGRPSIPSLATRHLYASRSRYANEQETIYFSTLASETRSGPSYNDLPSSSIPHSDPSLTSLRLEVHHPPRNGVGLLQSILHHFVAHGVNLRRIESRPLAPEHYQFDLTIDDPPVPQLLQSLRDAGHTVQVDAATAAIWFPQHRAELDQIIHRTIQASTTPDDTSASLSADHPGFRDPVYRQRRAELAAYAQQYRWADDHAGIPTIAYTEEETGVWTKVWDQMQPLLQKYACREYLHALAQMRVHCHYSRDRIPQQAEISQYLQQVTQFRLRPVAGLLSSRDFLNALALRVFCSTQYIRHASRPYYTPEPDICHELLGHVPMLTNPTFAHFSQQIGLASLGASDSDIDKLAKVCVCLEFRPLAVPSKSVEPHVSVF